MKLTLVNTKKVDDKKLEIYEIADYTVKVVTYENGFISINVRENRGGYLPTIYCRDDMEGNVFGFDIQTTSYGSLPIEEVKKMIGDLEEAIEVVEILTKEFVK